MIISKNPNIEEIEKLKEFKEKYKKLYPDYLQEEIDEKLLLGYTNNNDTINQIYNYLNIVDNNINAYYGFINILQKYFNLKTKILEVGAGTIPILAKYIKDKYNSDITLMEPSIIFEDLLDCEIKKEKFTKETDIEKYDLIIGYNPCGATEDMIRSALNNNKDFCIALCGCCFLPENYTIRTKEELHKYLINLVNELKKDNYEIIIEYLEDNYSIEDPILIGKKN